MRRSNTYTPVALVALIALTALTLAHPAAAADFTGKVKSVTSRQLAVERSGDRVSFEKVSETAVSGKRSSWAEIQVGDTVAVSWKLSDKPPRAHHVKVLKKRSKK